MSPAVIPDFPVPFGWGIGWYAVRSADPYHIAAELRLGNVRPSGWSNGLAEAHQTESIFVSPDIAGWKLIVGNALPFAPQEECLVLLSNLSHSFREAQYFGNDHVTEYHAWAKAICGRLRRAYAFSGEQGAVLWDRGEPTDEEVTLRLVFDENAILTRSPDDNAIFQLAERWSLNPTQVENVITKPGLGLLGNQRSESIVDQFGI